MRTSWSAGTRRGMAAVSAGPWNACAEARTAKSASMSGTVDDPDHGADSEHEREQPGRAVGNDHDLLAVESVCRPRRQEARGSATGRSDAAEASESPHGRGRGLGDEPDGGEAGRAGGEHGDGLPAPDDGHAGQPVRGQRVALGVQRRVRVFRVFGMRGGGGCVGRCLVHAGSFRLAVVSQPP